MALKKGLGKGLSALLRDDQLASPTAEGKDVAQQFLAIEQLSGGAFQPRQLFDDLALEELAESIKENGIIQPILVRDKKDASGEYEIIAGERRWRAAKLAGLTRVPVIVQNVTDLKALELAIIENIQRQDLTPLEEAEAYKRLLDEFNYTQEELAKEIGKSRSHIANLMRLLQLPDEVKAYIQKGQLSMGHARALINTEDPVALAKRIIEDGLNVRKIEAITSKKKNNTAIQSNQNTKKSEDIVALERTLTQALGLKVEIENAENNAGKVTLFFDNLTGLDKILQKLTRQ